VKHLLRSACSTLLFFILFSSVTLAQTLTGTFSLLTDSDGTHPGKGKTVTLIFRSDGTCHLQATDESGQNTTLNGDGTYTARASRITLSLPVLELSVSNRPYVLVGDHLTLPFMVFNEGAGTSTWKKAADAWSGAATGSGDNTTAPLNAPPPPPPPRKIGGGMHDELLCTCTDKAYDRPVDILPNCTRVPLGRPLCGAVLRKTGQPCPAFRTPNGFTTLYDQVVLGRPGPLSGMGAILPAGIIAIPSGSAANNKDPHTILIGTLIGTYFKPWGPADFYMTVQPGGVGDVEYAHVEEHRGLQHYLVVRGAAFTELSPAGMISALGHEMIHAEQLRRPGNLSKAGGLSAITAAMNELEASSWETKVSSFPWRIGPNPTWSCETPLERDRSEALRSCREWQIRELLGAINQKPKTQSDFEEWIKQNPWASINWLPKNPHWKQILTNDLPAQVPFPTDPEHGMDCHDVLVKR
jgi:hypothetical protein